MVTGGAGFLGSNLCNMLYLNGHRVICVDNFTTGEYRNISHLLDKPNFITVKHDVTDKLKIDEDINEIYNMACPASPFVYQKNPVTTIKINVLGMLNMLDLANIKGAKILQASTSEVYGDPLEHPQNEGYRGNVNFVGKRACYDEGKRCAEAMCFDYHREFDTKIKVVRIFNTYGPNMDTEDGRAIPNFIMQALRNKPVTIYGDGNQTRSFCYVDDLIKGIVKMMERDDFPGPVNIGNPEEISILDLAKKIIYMTGSESSIVFTPLPPDDPVSRRPSVNLANIKLRWEPNTALNEGLEKTILYFKERTNK